MKAELHKVTFQVHGVIRDNRGKIIDEIHSGGGTSQDGSPVEFKLWPHELDQLPDQVALVLDQIAKQAKVPPAPAQTGNRAQRRGAAKRAGAKKAS